MRGAALRIGDRRRGVLLREQRTHEAVLDSGVVGRELERLLEDGGGFVVRAAPQEHASDQAVLHHGLFRLVGAPVEVGQADLDLQVVGIDRAIFL